MGAGRTLSRKVQWNTRSSLEAVRAPAIVLRNSTAEFPQFPLFQKAALGTDGVRGAECPSLRAHPHPRALKNLSGRVKSGGESQCSICPFLCQGRQTGTHPAGERTCPAAQDLRWGRLKKKKNHRGKYKPGAVGKLSL